MKIYRPLKSAILTQRFGENLIPLYRELKMLGHNGEDWYCWKGEPIYHSGDFIGKAKTEVDSKGGIGVDVISREPLLEGEFVKLRYWHLQKVNVYDGQEIKPGDLIGWGDTTGYATESHLHFSLKPCFENGVALTMQNGYRGAIDYRFWFEDVFILDYLNIKQQLSLYQQVLKLYQLLFQKVGIK